MMFSTMLKEISSYYDRRFLATTYFPTLAFLAVNFFFGYDVIYQQNGLDYWQGLSGLHQVIMLASFFSIGLAVAYLLGAFQISLMRIFEGYWGEFPGIAQIKRLRIKVFEQKWLDLRKSITNLEDRMSHFTNEMEDKEKELDRLSNTIYEDATPDQITQVTRLIREIEDNKNQCEKLQVAMNSLSKDRYSFYPPNIHSLMPTRLGNIMRAAEYYPAQRYKIDAVILWMRLLLVLPASVVEGLKDAKANLDLLIWVSTFAGAFSFTWLFGILVVQPIRWELLLFVGLGWLLCFCAYLAAIQAALVFGEQIKTSFDLYRWELLKKLNLVLPKTHEEEIMIWEQVSGLIFRVYPPDNRYYRYNTDDPGNKKLIME